jgi:hypothetical protein
MQLGGSGGDPFSKSCPPPYSTNRSKKGEASATGLDSANVGDDGFEIAEINNKNIFKNTQSKVGDL